MKWIANHFSVKLKGNKHCYRFSTLNWVVLMFLSYIGYRGSYFVYLLILAVTSMNCYANNNSAKQIPTLDNYFKEVLNTSDGLPHNTINAIAQTQDGYLWFATWEGIARFNGHEFRIFDRSQEIGLPDSGTRAIHLDRHQALWFGGARGGLVRLKDDKWQSYPPTGGLINQLFLDKYDRLWIATLGQGLFMQDSTGKRVQYHQQDGLPSEQVHSMVQDKQGRIWVGTASGLVFIDETLKIQRVGWAEFNDVPVFALAFDHAGQLLVGTARGLYLYAGGSTPPKVLLEKTPVSAILPDSNQVVWVGTIDRGLLRLHGNTVEALGIRQGMPDNQVVSMHLDLQGSLWVGTNGGVFRLRDAPFSTFTVEQGLAGNYVRSVLSHDDGCLYIGSSRGLSRNCDDNITPIDLSSASVGQSVLSLTQGAEQEVWVGTYADGLIQLVQGEVQQHITVANGLASNEVRAILPLENGTVWVGTALGLSFIEDGHITNVREKDGLPSSFIMSLYMSLDGRLFIGTSTGIAILQDGQMRRLNLGPLDDARYVFGFADDPLAGLVWITTDRGLIAYDLVNNTMKMIGRDQGIPFDKLFQAVLDRQGGLWISGNRGVLRLEREEALAVLAGKQKAVNIQLFGESHGMISSQASGGSAHAATLHKDGSVWIATSIGVSRVQPKRLARFSQVIPPVVIEQLMVDGQMQQLNGESVLSAGANRLEIKYAGLGYVMSERLLYRTKLVGFDKNWVNRGTQSVAEYTNLPPGEYLFKVSAAYPGGSWSGDEAVIKMVLLPHFWQRWWFMLGIVVLSLGALMLGIRWRLIALKRSELQLRNLVSEQTAELQLLARQDALTGLSNRRAFDEELQQEYQRAHRNGSTLCLALLDVDHFKRVNDQYSHTVGDKVLKRIAHVLKKQCRTVDLIARWGGEEFVILLPETSLTAAVEVCERLRQKIEELNLNDLSPQLSTTVSIGLTNSRKVALSQLLSSADKALYKAKRSGRNCLVVDDLSA
jgi:diguanylate cyclase (GGDEF)-like protein